MHYGQTFTIVGEDTGDKDFDDLRFRTTNRDEFNFNKTKFGLQFPKPSRSTTKAAKSSTKRSQRK